MSLALARTPTWSWAPSSPVPDFLCSISMELMEDPVTVATGVTYDRRSIERWFFKLAVNVLWLVACAPAPAERVLPCWRTWRWAAPWRSCWR
uniref:U-box domain-containing protein n=1 Tax=Oryza barthii TaxID=65489 RepID=A0A0D3GC55_9ORYZ